MLLFTSKCFSLCEFYLLLFIVLKLLKLFYFEIVTESQEVTKIMYWKMLKPKHTQAHLWLALTVMTSSLIMSYVENVTVLGLREWEWDGKEHFSAIMKIFLILYFDWYYIWKYIFWLPWKSLRDTQTTHWELLPIEMEYKMPGYVFHPHRIDSFFKEVQKSQRGAALGPKAY